jgi:hypothetical protein
MNLLRFQPVASSRREGEAATKKKRRARGRATVGTNAMKETIPMRKTGRAIGADLGRNAAESRRSGRVAAVAVNSS